MISCTERKDKMKKARFSNRVSELVAIKARNERRVLTQRVLSQEIGLSLVVINRWYTNRISRIDADSVYKLCGYFGVSMNDLIWLEEESNASDSQKADTHLLVLN